MGIVIPFIKLYFSEEKKVKKTKRLLSLILAGTMLGSTAVFTANAKETAPKYSIDFVYDVDAETATATVSIEGGTYGVGRFGFSYNPDALVLLNKDGDAFDPAEDFMAEAIIGYNTEDYTVFATEETNLTADLVDTEAGSVLFAWATNGNAFIDATDSEMIIATVNFALSDEIADSDNPADALKNVENLIGEYEGNADEIPGWKNIYEAIGNDRKPVATDDVESSVNVSVDLKEITAKASGSTITVTWKPIADEEEADVVSYDVVVKDEDGNVIYSASKDAGKENLNSSKKYSVKITDDDGIEKNTKYFITVTPKTESGKNGGSAFAEVKTGKTTPTTDVGGDTSTEGVSLTYTVTYYAGEGTIPEGQKYKYNVNRNGYVGGSPAVIAPEGKVFAGWSVDGVTLVSVEVYKITKDTVFKAIYVEREEDTHRPFILGYPGGEVRADDFLTRAEAATIIARVSPNFDSEKTYTVNFTDVPADHWAANYIGFVYENNIVTGYEDNTFHPASNITRAEFATIMQRHFALELNEDSMFSDVDKDHWAVAYIGACKFAGLINGYENGEFRPSNSITRAEAVKILNRAADRIPTPTAIDAYIAEKGIPFEDLDSAKWYFYEIMEAAFPHLISYYH